jgi:hypothetical protein
MNLDNIAWVTEHGLFGAVVMLLMVVGFRSRRKAERVCRELVANSFNELKLINSAYVSNSFSSFRDAGILALLNDRLVFVSTLFNRQWEIPLGQITAIKLPRFSTTGGSRGMKAISMFVIFYNGKKMRITMQMSIMGAWVAALEKSTSLLAVKKIV